MYLNEQLIKNYSTHLQSEEKSPATAEKYLRCINRFAAWLEGKPVTKQNALSFKDYLKAENAPQTVNTYLAAINSLFAYANQKVRIKYLKIQRTTYRDDSRDLSRNEYNRLISACRSDERTSLLIETLGSTGIRVSEVQYITVEAAKNRRTDISLKGKIRTIVLPERLCVKLLAYAKERKRKNGCIFITKNGRPLDRRQIWYELKQAAKRAGVLLSKVFPHNLRHLFAVEFYKESNDIARLSSMLGHSNINTTMIYLKITFSRQIEDLEKMKMVS